MAMSHLGTRVVGELLLLQFDELCPIKLNSFFTLVVFHLTITMFAFSPVFLSLVLLLFIHFVCCLSSTHELLVVLGSADDRILSERVSAAILYIQSSDKHIILFISGGVKNAFTGDDKPTEASRAAKAFDFEHVQIVLDELATNTAENFAYLKRWVTQNFSHDDLPTFVITTSDFHQLRAERLFQGIIPDVTPLWNLSKSSCSRCWSDETFHIKNVDNDILKARHIT